MIKLPKVDESKLNESYRLKTEARELRERADELEQTSDRLRRAHYFEQYDHCRACNNGVVGEGLTSHSCSHCNSGLLPKGTLPIGCPRCGRVSYDRATGCRDCGYAL